MQVSEIRWFYHAQPVKVPESWELSRRHLRLETLNHKFLKLNKLENRINARALRKYCIRYAPRHVYASVLRWLFPERVGKKSKANHAVPVNGDFVVDIDAYVIKRWDIQHDCLRHNGVCWQCVDLSKRMTVQLCEKIESYYSKVAVVFSGNKGFHVHVQDFDLTDWTYYNDRNPIKSHEVARLKFSRLLALQTYVYDRSHFILSVDPMRILSVSGTLNADTGLVCQHVGDRKDLEAKTIASIIEQSNPVLQARSRSEAFKPMKLFTR